MNGTSYRLRQSKTRRRKDPATSDEPFIDPETGSARRCVLAMLSSWPGFTPPPVGNCSAVDKRHLVLAEIEGFLALRSLKLRVSMV